MAYRVILEERRHLWADQVLRLEDTTSRDEAHALFDTWRREHAYAIGTGELRIKVLVV